MAQGPVEEAREPAGASDGAAVAAGWAAEVSVWVENAYAPIAVRGLAIREALPAPRFGVQTADRRWGGKYEKYRISGSRFRVQGFKG